MKIAAFCGLAFTVGFIIAVVLSKTVLAPLQPMHFDLNNDRALSFVEFRSAVSAMFELVDANGDSKLSRNEVATLTKQSGGGLAASIAGVIRFERFDTNSDDVITLDEARNADRLARLFGEHDRNSDGEIDSDEIEGFGLGALLIKE